MYSVKKQSDSGKSFTISSEQQSLMMMKCVYLMTVIQIPSLWMGYPFIYRGSQRHPK